MYRGFWTFLVLMLACADLQARVRLPHAIGDNMVLCCDDVKAPVAVRYCYRDFQLGNLVNKGGLPLIPFRTDKW
ncbi:MAG: hypothetical protein ACI350_08130 [Prevotella sp.]